MRTQRTRRSIRIPALAAAALVLAPFAATSTAAGATSGPAATTASQFVRRDGAHLVLAGKEFTFAGSNNYYPMYKSSAMVDALFDKAAAARFDVMRVWGSREIGNADGTNAVDPATGSDGFYLQYWDAAAGKPAFNDGANGIQKLDYMIASARARGIRLVIPLVNNWNNFGGMDQYVRWAGKQFHDDFYTDPTIRSWYKAWIKHLLTHVNP